MDEQKLTAEQVANVYECGWDDETDNADVYEVRTQARKEFFAWLAVHDAEVRASVEVEQGWEYALMTNGDDEPWSNCYESREHLAGQCRGLAWRDDEHLVRRRKAGKWVPVEQTTESGDE